MANLQFKEIALYALYVICPWIGGPLFLREEPKSSVKGITKCERHLIQL